MINRSFLLLLGLFFMSSALLGQEQQTEGSSSGDAISSLKIQVDLVLVNATVTDISSRFVMGLEKQHFRLFEDKVEQKIKYFSNEDVPVSIGLLFDISGSMGNKIARSRDAAVAFLKTSNPADEYFLMAFADRPLVEEDFNDASYEGFRLSSQSTIGEDWEMLLVHMKQDISADGVFDYDPEKGDLALKGGRHDGQRRQVVRRPEQGDESHGRDPVRKTAAVGDGLESPSRRVEDAQQAFGQTDLFDGCQGSGFGQWRLSGVLVETANVGGVAGTGKAGQGRFADRRSSPCPPRAPPPTGRYSPSLYPWRSRRRSTPWWAWPTSLSSAAWAPTPSPLSAWRAYSPWYWALSWYRPPPAPSPWSPSTSAAAACARPAPLPNRPSPSSC